ncbi:DNA polymerase III polC-type, putative isoform 2 [Hibiscus syriacus]|uniref:DNA polymerase III polC-type, putative isoform 2 n=1 Tax=Hibiscus syriacus TaxID=106335 RepID=A0A6A3B8K0_HIBSY|nr:DNA polymerase III polC-type, putative isoform 2 [Hibiscus syriacus]
MTTKTDGRNKTNQAAKPSNLIRKILDEKKDDRIIEIALQDLSGGENSTFQTLVNPGCYVANSHVHGITTNMVCRPDVPRMEELIPILLHRCSYEIPPNWLFMDTLSLARELMKSGGTNLPSGISVKALREHYRIPLVGSAHRAMTDVRTLAMILQMLTFDLKLSLPNLITRSSTASEYLNNKRKKS